MNWGIFGGGGAKYFFSGPKRPPRLYTQETDRKSQLPLRASTAPGRQGKTTQMTSSIFAKGTECCVSKRAKFQARKRNPNLNFLVRIFSGGVGVFHVKGWVPKSSVCPSKPGKSDFFGGISRDFAGISGRCPEKFEKKNYVFYFCSLKF